MSARHANAHAVVNAAFALNIDASTLTITSASAAVGGLISCGLFIPTRASSQLAGKSLLEMETLRSWVTALQSEATARGLSPSPLHSDSYRLNLLASFAYKLFLSALNAHGRLPGRLASCVASSLAAAEDRAVTSATQSIDVSDPKLLPVSQPLPKLAAVLQASGEAKYTSDLGCGGTGATGCGDTALSSSSVGGAWGGAADGGGGGGVGGGGSAFAGGLLFGAFVSTGPGSVGASFDAIDASEARGCPGYLDLVTAADFPVAEANRDVGDDTQTTPCYLLEAGRDTVPCVGAHVALVLADTAAHARFAAKHIRLTLTHAPPPPPPPPPSLDAWGVPIGIPIPPPNSGTAKASGAVRAGAAFALSHHHQRVISADRFDESVRRLAAPSGNAGRLNLPLARLEATTATAKMAMASAPAAARPWPPRRRRGGGRRGGRDALWSGCWQTAERVDGRGGRRAAQGEIGGSGKGKGGSGAAPSVIHGRFDCGGQKHFYLETQSALACPQEDRRWVVWTGNQNPRRTQTQLAKALGVSASRVDVRIRRTGGAFGGKLNAHLPTAVVAAVAAAKARRPVLVHSERCDDMTSGGGRPPMVGSWSAAVQPDGTIDSLRMDLAFDSGCTDGAGGAGDLGMGVVSALLQSRPTSSLSLKTPIPCLLPLATPFTITTSSLASPVVSPQHWSDNAYRHRDFACTGRIVRTPVVGNTSCRAPGVIQSVALHEMAIEAQQRA